MTTAPWSRDYQVRVFRKADTSCASRVSADRAPRLSASTFSTSIAAPGCRTSKSNGVTFLRSHGGTMRIAICVAVLLSATAGVASAQRANNSPAASPACSFLTKEDAAAALGEAANGPKGTGAAGTPSSCEYTGSGIHSVNLNVIPLKAGEAAVYKAMCAQKTKDGLTGLGDVTCWYNDKHGELQL